MSGKQLHRETQEEESMKPSLVQIFLLLVGLVGSGGYLLTHNSVFVFLWIVSIPALVGFWEDDKIIYFVRNTVRKIRRCV